MLLSKYNKSRCESTEFMKMSRENSNDTGGSGSLEYYPDTTIDTAKFHINI